MKEGHTLYIVGNSTFSCELTGEERQNHCSLAFEIDTSYFVILKASCTFSYNCGQKFNSAILEGNSLLEGEQPLINIINTYFYGFTKSALIDALRDIFKQFSQYKKHNKQLIF